MKSILSSERSLKDDLSGDPKFCLVNSVTTDWQKSLFFPVLRCLLPVVKVCLHYENSGRPGNRLYLQNPFTPAGYGDNMRENGDSVNIG